MDTTVGQLNFFEWAITDEVLDYLEKNHEAVHADMESRLHEMKEEKVQDDVPKRKRHELSRSATKSLARHNINVKVSFD